MNDLDVLAQSMNSEDSHSVLVEGDLENQKRGKTINSPSKNLRVFDEDSDGEIVLKPIKDVRKKEKKAGLVRQPGASDSEPSQGSAWTMADDEIDDHKLQIVEDFELLHVKIMALTE
jgi:hypothetical protein